LRAPIWQREFIRRAVNHYPVLYKTRFGGIYIEQKAALHIVIATNIQLRRQVVSVIN
jgi:hypothetical protein